MSGSLRHLLGLLLQMGYFGPVLMGVFDSSFLFLPFGNDLLIVALTVRHHERLPGYVAMAALGSAIGVLLLHFVAHKGGEEGLRKRVNPRRFDYLKDRLTKYGAVGVVLACLAPPPFPFTLVIGAVSALGYPRWRLIAIVMASRIVRFTLIGLMAIHFGRTVLRVANSPQFVWGMAGFAVLCLAGSGLSIANWIRQSRTAAPTTKA